MEDLFWGFISQNPENDLQVILREYTDKFQDLKEREVI